MIKSMTAYATAEKKDPRGVTVAVEIRTVNSRHLDLSIRLPNGLAALEDKIKGLIHDRLVRGRVELRLTYKDESENAIAYQVDAAKLRSYLACLETIKSQTSPTASVTLDFLASIPGMIRPADNDSTAEDCWPLIASCLEDALTQVDQMRSQEGDFIGRDLAQRLDSIESQLDGIQTAASDLPALYREKLLTRIDALTEGAVELDPVRVAQEVAILADRSDISEEIIRVRSHLEQFRSMALDGQPAGRRLNFLLQEFNREFNTMGSKAGQAEINHVIVDIKAEIEKIREQVQNIE